MARTPLTEWNGVTIATDQRDAAGLGETHSFTVNADGTWQDQDAAFFENFGIIGVTDWHAQTLGAEDPRQVD